MGARGLASIGASPRRGPSPAAPVCRWANEADRAARYRAPMLIHVKEPFSRLR